MQWVRHLNEPTSEQARKLGYHLYTKHLTGNTKASTMASTTMAITIGSGTPLAPERAACSCCLSVCISVLYWPRRSSSARFSSVHQKQRSRISEAHSHTRILSHSRLSGRNVLSDVTLACKHMECILPQTRVSKHQGAAAVAIAANDVRL